MKKQVLALTLAALLVLPTGCRTQTAPAPSAESPAPTDTPVPSPENTAAILDISDPSIVWCNGVDGDDEMWETRLPNGSAVTYQLKAALDAGSDDDLFAVVVCILGSGADSTRYNRETYDILREASTQAQTHLNGVYQTVTEKLALSLDISIAEAGARAFSDPDFIAAREAASTAELTADRYKLEWNFEKNGEALYALEKLGFTLVCRADDPAFQNYLSLFYSLPLGIAIGTKEQLCNLPVSYHYRFYLAAKDAAEYEPWMPLTYYEHHLTEDSKLTDELIAVYEGNGGAAYPVNIQIGYLGEEISWADAKRQALAIVGYPSVDDLYAYGTAGERDRYIEETNRIGYHKDYNDQVAALLREDELVYLEHSSACIYAKLTYERALELAKNKEIAYITLIPEHSGALETLDWDYDE